MKKIIALLLALTLVLTMVGCGGKKEYLAGTVSDTGVVAIGVPGQPANTDPALYDGSLAARAVLGMLYQGLTAVDENGQAVGAAAESWEISATDDAVKRPVYTFTLREGACWSDGTPVKAEDFITAWTRVISGAVDRPCRYLFDVILGARDYENEESELGLEANAPYNGESWDLISLTRLSEGNRERLRRPSREAAALDALPSRRPPAHAAPERKTPDASTAYGQLVLAGEKLSALIRRMQGRGARQQSRLARQINLLVKKFGGR